MTISKLNAARLFAGILSAVTGIMYLITDNSKYGFALFMFVISWIALTVLVVSLTIRMNAAQKGRHSK